MPELPEVEVVRRGLKAKILGETVAAVEIFREQSIGYPAQKKFTALLAGRTFTDVSRRGKYLLLHLDGKAKAEQAYLIVHLRMSGRLVLIDKQQVDKKKFKFLRVRMILNSGKALCFEDMRVFGRLYYVASNADLAKAIPSFAKLGIEPLENFTDKQLLEFFKNSGRAIKTALLDQTLIAGIGNIYADEVLYQSGIHPLTRAAQVTAKQAKLLAEIIPKTLKRAIERGGSSIKDFVDSEGVNGNYQHESAVYGRTGKPCRKCKTAIARLKLLVARRIFVLNAKRRKIHRKSKRLIAEPRACHSWP